MQGRQINMEHTDLPLYSSPPTRKSLGNEYSIFADRIELKCRFPFVSKTFVIQRSDLVSIGTFKPPVIRTSLKALKLDLADLNEHVGITRRSGFFRQIRFTPDHPREFVSRAKELLGIDE